MTQLADGRSTAPRARSGKPDRTPSFLFDGHAPRRRGLVLLLGALFGFALTVVWSAEFVDKTVGGTISETLLGHPAADAPISGALAGIAFALATGIGGTFTACNIAVFSAMAPLAGQASTRRGRITAMLVPLGHLVLGAVAVSALYGMVAALAGTGMPQFQESVPGATGFSPRIVQAMVVYGIMGLLMVYLGLAAAGLVRDPLARITARYPHAPMLLMGGLIGGFLLGRPYGLFRQLFRDTAESHNLLYGAAAFALQTLGNVVIVAVVLLVVSALFGDRLHRWLSARPGRVSALMAASFTAAGVFLVLYWDVRMLARRDLIWYPMAPWAG
ncbi:hypothetical protein [Streptomyces sp. NPDC097619]|uniref:hypothetical protein n=1 Tax=Streptomyces sp. NPDC097619 TaxID=3157228 RepID=UPI0033236CFB